MRTFRQPGHVLTWENDTGADVESGDVVIVEDMIAVATTDIADTEEGSVTIVGVHALAKTDAQAWNQGAIVHWDSDNDEFTTAVPANGVQDAGKAAADAAAADTEAEVLLTSQSASAI
jgi:predicted RecA/RadA family phage recombinase